MVDVLAIAAHPDDAEIGAGGVIALLGDRGLSVGILDLTNGEPTPHGSVQQRRREATAAASVLGVKWRRCLELPNRSLEPSLDARRAVAAIIRELRPRILLAHHWHDVHPDHVAASQLAEAARFWAKLSKSDLPFQPHWCEAIYYFFGSHLRAAEPAAFAVDISPAMERKLRAVATYESQFGAGRSVVGRSGSVVEQLRTRARYWGWLTGVEYAEPFATREPIALPLLPRLLN